MGKKFSLLDIFSGPGGLSLGLQLSEFFEPTVAIENNHYAAGTYQRNFPNSSVIEAKVESVSSKDVLKKARIHGFQRIDAICGGPPCRPFSKANRGKTQWKVVKSVKKISVHPDWKNYLRFVKELKPKFVIAENVMGFRSNKDVSSYFVRNLKKLGYTVHSPILESDKSGVPQRRKRILIIAIRAKVPEKSLQPLQSGEQLKVIDAIYDLPSLSNENPGSFVSKYEDKKISPYASKLKGTQKTLYNHQAHSVHDVMKKRFSFILQGYNLKRAWTEKMIPKEVLRSSYALMGRRRLYTIKSLEKIHSNIYRRLSWGEICPTLTNARKTVLIHPSQDRLLSVRECARLQSFPDFFAFSGSLNQQYQQVADAVPPLLMIDVANVIVPAYRIAKTSVKLAKTVALAQAIL